MNYFADIEEGFDVFDDERERKASEALFQKQPALVTLKVEERDFYVASVNTIHLVGSTRAVGPAPIHPFDFEEGYFAATGHFKKPYGMSLAHTAEVRWSDYGKTLQVNVTP